MCVCVRVRVAEKSEKKEEIKKEKEETEKKKKKEEEKEKKENGEKEIKQGKKRMRVPWMRGRWRVCLRLSKEVLLMVSASCL